MIQVRDIQGIEDDLLHSGEYEHFPPDENKHVKQKDPSETCNTLLDIKRAAKDRAPSPDLEVKFLHYENIWTWFYIARPGEFLNGLQLTVSHLKTIIAWAGQEDFDIIKAREKLPPLVQSAPALLKAFDAIEEDLKDPECVVSFVKGVPSMLYTKETTDAAELQNELLDKYNSAVPQREPPPNFLSVLTAQSVPHARPQQEKIAGLGRGVPPLFQKHGIANKDSDLISKLFGFPRVILPSGGPGAFKKVSEDSNPLDLSNLDILHEASKKEDANTGSEISMESDWNDEDDLLHRK